MTSFMDGPCPLFHNQLPKTGGQNFCPALRIAELLLIGRHDGCHINCLIEGVLALKCIFLPFRQFLLLVTAVSISVVWAVFRKEDWAWALQGFT